MYIKKSYFTLILIALTFSVWNIAQADYSQALDIAAENELDRYRRLKVRIIGW